MVSRDGCTPGYSMLRTLRPGPSNTLMLRHLIITLFVCWQLKYTWIINIIMFNGPSYSSLLITLTYIYHHISWHADIPFCKNIFLPYTPLASSMFAQFWIGISIWIWWWRQSGCGGGKGNRTSKNLMNYFRLNACHVHMYVSADVVAVALWLALMARIRLSTPLIYSTPAAISMW